MIKIINEGEQIPLFYGKVGVAWTHYSAFEVAPMPLNFLIKLWYWILHKQRPSKMDIAFRMAEARAESRGYEIGHSTGYTKGLSDGRKKGRDEYATELSRLIGNTPDVD